MICGVLQGYAHTFTSIVASSSVFESMGIGYMNKTQNKKIDQN